MAKRMNDWVTWTAIGFVVLVVAVAGWEIFGFLEQNNFAKGTESSVQIPEPDASQSTQKPSRSKPPLAVQDRGNSVLYILSIHSGTSPDLQKWATDWHSQTTIKLPRLETLIDKSDLSSTECLQIGVMLAHNEGYNAGKLWISAGLKRALSAVPQSAADDASARPLLLALALAQDGLNGHADAASLLEQINSLITRLDGVNDWDQTREWARIHHADALLLEGRSSEANAECSAMVEESIKNSVWTMDEKQELSELRVRFPVDPQAKSPLEVLKLHGSPSANLLTWMNSWQASHNSLKAPTTQKTVDDLASRAKRSELGDLIASTDLTARECLRIGELMAPSDPLDAEVFDAIGAKRASSELANIPPEDFSILPMINDLKRAETRINRAPESVIERGVALEIIDSIFMEFDCDDISNSRRQWAAINHAEALYMQQRYAEALTEADELESEAICNPHFSSQQRTEIEWLQSLVLYYMNRFSDALPHLECTAMQTEFSHANQAWAMWAVALARTGNSDAANRVFDQWIRLAHPSTHTAAVVLGNMQSQQSSL